MAKETKVSTKHKQLDKASNTLFVTVIVASVVVSFCIVFLNILWGQSRFNSRIHAAKEAARDTLEVNLATIDDLQASFIALELGDNLIQDQGNTENSAVILDALPSRYDFPALASSIDNLVKRSGVALADFSGVDEGTSAEQTSADPQPISIDFSLTVEGTYDNIIRFIDALENSIRPIAVSQLQLSGTDGSMRATFEATTYYQPAVDLDLQTRSIE